MTPYWQSDCDRYALYHGDCRDVMASMDAESVDAIVCDPPYGLEFMGKEWDRLWRRYELDGDRGYHSAGRNAPKFQTARPSFIAGPQMQDWHQTWAAAALRVAKPGAHLLAFGGTRTYHRLVCAIEDAGWEVRNMIGWVYGSGFPKNVNVGRSIDTALCPLPGKHCWSEPRDKRESWHICPRTAHGEEHDNLGTSLKPAIEPICLARKPLDGTVAANVLRHGCGGLNIDGCRIPTRDFDGMTAETFSGVKSGVGSWNRADKGIFDAGRRGGYLNGPPSGRWPANLIHDGSDEVVAGFPQSVDGVASPNGGITGMFAFGRRSYSTGHGGSGSAARFFYAAQMSIEDMLWTLGIANSADDPICLTNESSVSALARAVASTTGALALSRPSYRAPSTNVTASVFVSACASIIEAMRSFAGAYLSGSPPTNIIVRRNRVRCVVVPTQTGTMTITIRLLTLDGSVAVVTFDITAESAAHGVVDSGNGNGRRLYYTAKASSDDRDGCKHPTMKPTDLMRHLCRLVTPPNGIVLDPFMGSGTTGKAARLEGFRFVGVDQDEGYCRDARRRIGQVETNMFAEASA